MSYVDMSYVDMSYVDMSYVDMSYVDMSYVDMSYVMWECLMIIVDLPRHMLSYLPISCVCDDI